MDLIPYLCVLYLLVMPVLSWNIETKFLITFPGPKDSYFGFNVALHDNSKGSFALIAATKANSSIPTRQMLHQPGVLYSCDIITKDCKEVEFQENASIRDKYEGNSKEPYYSKEDNMWLGVSLDVQPVGKGDIVTCAHLWRNQVYPGHYLTNGACYTINRDLRKTHHETLLPFIKKGVQSNNGIYLYAFGQVGTSAAYSEDGDLILGAPGFYDWIGTVISYRLPGYPQYSPDPFSPYPPGGPTPESYIGYSVSSGRFFKLGEEQFVTGAPRDAGNKGKIYIFESLRQHHGTIIVKQDFEGEQIGAYYGAYVLGVDINNDSYTDLLVGSPFFSLRSGGDEGKVYVYMSNGMGLENTQEIMGSRKTDSRFGTTIANAGDLNQDGYIDIAVGAPYEDGVGVVYIYHGRQHGISTDYVQRIDVRSSNPSLSGFGISISRGKDIDNNYYPDLLIGSYLSDKAFLFRTRPVVKMYASILFEPQQINANYSVCLLNNRLVPCFNVSFCLNYVGSYIPLQLNVSIKLSSARKRDVLQTRRYFFYQNKLSSYLERNVTIKKGYPHCFPHPAYVSSDPNDFITPIQVTLDFQLTHDVTTEEIFCKFCPVLDPKLPSSISRTVTFQTECGEDNTCISDLELTVNIYGLSSGEVIVGQETIITLSIELENHKEPAHMAEIQISLPDDVIIINQDNCWQDRSNDQIIICQAGNPLKAGRIVKYEIKFDASLVSTELDHIVINVTATTASEEENKADNERTIYIPLKLLADIAIVGYTDVEQIILGRGQPDPNTTDIIHVYTVLKHLPSPIKAVLVEILVPTTFAKSNISFLQLKSIGINEASTSPVSASCNFSQVDLQPESAEFEEKKEVLLDEDIFRILPTPSPKRSINKRSIDNKQQLLDAAETSTSVRRGSNANHILKCTNSKCSKISCVAGPFTQKRTSATFRISGFVNISSLQKVLTNWDSVTIITEGKVKITNHKKNVQPKIHRPDEAKVTTTIVHATPLPAKRIAIWMVAVSVAAGVLLFVLLVLGLVKLGFFRRQKKEDMEKMMAKAELKEWDPYMVTDEQVEVAKEDFESGGDKC